MHFSYAKPLCLKGCQSNRSGYNVIADRADPRVQRGAMQRVALAKLMGLMNKAARFALESIVNFKFRLIHRYLPARRINDAILK
ncbi:hypothetical protein ALP40_02545 [Pseudomonas viridiflava]|uniref:Uncharacterized protein n=1 Tax=Pseudomonas viridiflava TaxID=33069 RepID=A0A3M5PIL0_PSEVI|nr:hypothetical protein ALP40_02545 [Pseudomonas viridiflava]